MLGHVSIDVDQLGGFWIARELNVGHRHAILRALLGIRRGVRMDHIGQVEGHGLSGANEAIPEKSGTKMIEK